MKSRFLTLFSLLLLAQLAFSQNQWTWMKGSKSANVNGVYGAKGVSSSNNNPGTRIGPATWTDSQGNFWLFGGRGLGESGSDFGPLNDLWRFNPSNQEWTWISGSKTITQPGEYGFKGIPSPFSYPGGRHNGAAWTDNQGNFWLFGGFGVAKKSAEIIVPPPVDPPDEDPDNNPPPPPPPPPDEDPDDNPPPPPPPPVDPPDEDPDGNTPPPPPPPVDPPDEDPDNNNSPPPVDPPDEDTTNNNPPPNEPPAEDTTNNNPPPDEPPVEDTTNNNPPPDEPPVEDTTNNNPPPDEPPIEDTTNNNPPPDEPPVEDTTNINPPPDEPPVEDTTNNNPPPDGPGEGGEEGDDSVLEDPEPEGYLNDLWMYSPSTGVWTWKGGSDQINQTGDYGNRTQPASSNQPGGRYSATAWTDKSGIFWMFGGRGFSEDDQASHLNDLWKFNPSENTWTWMKGDEQGDANEKYGDKGTFDDDHIPGGRRGGAAWTDLDGNLWLYGGGTLSDLYSDLWQYSISRNQWMWVNGTKSSDKRPEVDEIGIPDKDNNPGARRSSATYVDTDGNLWLFGGRGYGGNTGENPLNSMWKYTIGTDEWTLVSGSISISPEVVFGERGVEDPENQPGGMNNTGFWRDRRGDLWVFGGESGNGYINQVWRFSFACSKPPVGSITPTSASICDGGSQELTASGGTSYSWRRNGFTLAEQPGEKLTVTQPGTYTVIITKDGCSAPATNSVSVKLVTKPTGTISPAKTTVCEGGSQILKASGGTTYEWKLNDEVIAGETGENLEVTAAGTYSVTIFNGNCSGPASNTAEVEVVASPNGNISPASAVLCENGSQVLTALGGTTYQWQLNGEDLEGETASTLTVTAPGTYSLLIGNGTCSVPAANNSVVTLAADAGVRYPDVRVTPNIPAQLNAAPGALSYEWTPATGLDLTNVANPMVTTSEEREYLIRINPAEGCIRTDTLSVKIRTDNQIFVPTAFTPDGNGVNDLLRPLGNMSQVVDFKVYNRWGNLVHQSSGFSGGWDGRYNGVAQPSDTYSWVLVAIMPDGEQTKLSGKSLLIR